MVPRSMVPRPMVTRWIVPLLCLALAPAAIAAPAKTTGLTLKVTSRTVLYGHSVTISGRLGGAGAGKPVQVEARAYGTSAPRVIGVVRTSADGSWSLRTKPQILTTYVVHSGSTTSRTISVGVAPAIELKELASGHLRVTVKAGHSLGGGLIQLQKPVKGGHWKTIERKALSASSITVLAPSISTKVLRVSMSVNQAGPGFLGAASHRFVYRPVALTLTPAAYRVLFGHALLLTGKLVNGGAGQHITIYSHPYGQVWKKLETVTTRAGGRYTLLVQPTIQTSYVAKLGGVRSSKPRTIGVQPALSVRRLAGNHIQAFVASSVKLNGRMVELQQKTGNTWKTVAKKALSRNSTANFQLTGNHTTFRVAMSVNQAGAGLLGAASHPLLSV